MDAIGRALKEGEVKLVAAPGLVARSGQLAKVTSGKQLRVPTGWQEKAGAKTMLFETLDAGITLEVDPVVGSDGETIEMNVAIEVASSDPIFRELSVISPGGEVVAISVPEVDKATLTTSIVFRDRQTLYIGALGGEEDGQVLVALVTGNLATAHREMVIPE